MKKLLSILTLLFVSVVTTACINNLAVQELNNKAKEYLQNGDTDKAISRLKSSLDLDGSVFETHYNLAVAYIKDEKYNLALEQLKEAKEIKSDNPDLYYTSAIAYEEYAYSMLNDCEEENDNINDIDKKDDDALSSDVIAQVESLLNLAIDNYNTYLNMSKDAKDKTVILEQIKSLENKLNEIKLVNK